MVTYRKAVIGDLKHICRFCDFWLSGRGARVGAQGAVNDCFITPGQYKRYINRYKTMLAVDGFDIVGWAVVDLQNCLIHLLVHGNWRGVGIGKTMVKLLDPQSVRCKFDQSTGDPGGFYIKQGFHKTQRIRSHSRVDIDKIRPDREPCIDIYER